MALAIPALLPAALHAYRYSDYLALEEHSLVRHEFVRGEIYAMAGGTPEHAALAATVLRLVGNQLPKGCRSYTSDLRVRIDASDVTTYPDGSVICGTVERSPVDALAAINPILIIEVTSSSTETYDRSAKLEQYKLLPSVKEVLLVSHSKAQLTAVRRATNDAWTMHEAASGESLQLWSIGGSLPVDDVYEGVFGDP
jgi:Uma2 family endonuclease